MQLTVQKMSWDRALRIIAIHTFVTTLFIYLMFGERYSGLQDSNAARGFFLSFVGAKLQSKRTPFEELWEDPITISLKSSNLTRDNRSGQDGPYKLVRPGKDPKAAVLLKYFHKMVSF